MISMEMLQDARRVLSPVINQTPVLHAPGLVPDCDFYLKADSCRRRGPSSCGARTIRSPPCPTRRSAGALSPAPQATMPRAWALPPGI